MTVRGEGVFEAMKKVKGLRKTTPKTQRYRPQYGDYQRENGGEQGEEGKRGMSADGRRLNLGGEHTVQ